MPPGDDELRPEELELAAEFVHPGEPRTTRRTWITRGITLLVTAVGLYVVWPGLLKLFAQTSALRTLEPAWFLAALLAELVSIAVGVLLVAEVLATDRFFVCTTSQLASNGIGRVVPGGAAGGALQYSMLVGAGFERTRVLTGLAAMNLLITAVPFAMPILLLPAILGGAPIDRSLREAAWIGIAGFVILCAGAAIVVAFDAPLRWAGEITQIVRNRVLRKRSPMTGFPERLLEERNLTRHILGRRWWAALGTAIGTTTFDYLALVASLAAVGAHPKPSLVLLAYVASRVLALIPITPGGLGFVEAGLVGMLTLAGVSGTDASLAVLAYRLISYWLPLPLGAVAYAVHRMRFGPADRGIATT